MFNVYLIWNKNYILQIFKSSLFDIITYSYDFLENKHYILKIKYKLQLSGLKLNPVMVNHPRYSSTGERCMALFFMHAVDSINELVIDTRMVDYCDFVDYIHPINNINNVDDIIQRQGKYWRWFQYFNHYVVDFSIKELKETYLISLTHGMDINITCNDSNFNITKRNFRMMELMAYGKDYEIPKVEDIIVNIL